MDTTLYWITMKRDFFDQLAKENIRYMDKIEFQDTVNVKNTVHVLLEDVQIL